MAVERRVAHGANVISPGAGGCKGGVGRPAYPNGRSLIQRCERCGEVEGDLPALATKIAPVVDHEVGTLTGGEACLAALKRDARRLAEG